MTTDSDALTTASEPSADEPVEAPPDEQPHRARPRWRRVLAGVTTALALLLVLFALVGPSQLDKLTPLAFLRVPVEGLVAVGLVLLLAYRSARRALVPLIPVVLATGWSSLVLWISQIPLNPMSAALGALTIAIATEFSVILAARFREERSRGGVEEAIERAYDRTGPAVLASAVTVIAGFAVLIASDVAMLREFGFVTVIDLGVALAGVMVALPAALVLLERER